MTDFFGRLSGQDQRERQRRMDDLLEWAGLAPLSNRPTGKLSGGMKQRVGLRCALIHDPDLFIVDEPTSGVDPVVQDGLWQILASPSRKDRVAIFISTHFVNEAELSDRVSRMHAGKVLASDTPKGIVETNSTTPLEEAFIGNLEDTIGERPRQPEEVPPQAERTDGAIAAQPTAPSVHLSFNFQRMFAYVQHGAIELGRDPVRVSPALIGDRILMLVVDIGNLVRILRSNERPAQLIFAGKAHPQDRSGQDLIRLRHGFARNPELRTKASDRKLGTTTKASTSDPDLFCNDKRQDPSRLFWKIIMALTMVLFAYNAVGMSLFGPNWLTVYWDALDDWCAGGYCR